MALITRIKTWALNEVLRSPDLNAEFDNILNNLSAANVEDYSDTVVQMQLNTDPGEVGTESQATSVAGEIERLRFVLKEIKGDVPQWYSTASTSLSEISAALGTSLDGNRISSGLRRTDSSQPVYLVPNGATNEFKVDGDTTNLAYFVDGTAVTITTEVTVTGVSTAPSTNNTALVNSPGLSDPDSSKILGEYGTTIPIDAAGTEITALVGGLAAFQKGSEYFIARVKSSTELTEARRGYFFDSSSNPVIRETLADNDTLTLLRITWVFGKDDGTVVTSTSEPTWSADEPSGAVSDDYWFDLVNQIWKVFSGGSFGDADATFLGIVVSDSSNTIGGRSLEFAGSAVQKNPIDLEKTDANTIRAIQNRPIVGVYSQTIKFDYGNPEWAMDGDLESGLSESANTDYYLYLTEDGDEVLSDKIPYDRTGDLCGYYHPHHVWRCVGQVRNDASSDFEDPQVFEGVKTIFPTEQTSIRELTFADGANISATDKDEILLVDASADNITIDLQTLSGRKGRKLLIERTDKGGLQYNQDFNDGNVTPGTDNIALASHPFVDLQKVRLTNTGGALPAGLATATDYWIILVDANNIELAASFADAQTDTAVDITAAAGGGTHNIQNEATTLTIDPDGSDAFADGDTTKVLYTPDENYEILPNLTNWRVLSHNTRMKANITQPLIITAVTTDPTKGTTNVDEWDFNREGGDLVGSMRYEQTGTGTAGSGQYWTGMVLGLQIDSTRATFQTSTNVTQGNGINVGYMSGSEGASFSTQAGLIPYDADRLRVVGLSGGVAQMWSSSVLDLAAAAMQIGGTVRIPVLNWKP